MGGHQRTQILHQDLLGLQDIVLGAEHGTAVTDDLARHRVKDTNAVVVADTGLLGDQLLDLLDGGRRRHVNGRGEVLDRAGLAAVGDLELKRRHYR